MMRHATAAVIWFRRDLRIHDHPALAAAAADGRPIVPVYVFDPRLLNGRFASPNRTWFLLGSLRALAADLASLGAPLIVRVGDPVVVVPEVVRAAGARDVHVSRDHAPYGRARDRAVAEALARDGAQFHRHAGNLVHEPEAIATAGGRPYAVYSPFRRAWERLPRRAALGAPARLTAADQDPGTIPTLAMLGLGDAPTADPDLLPEAGEPAARLRLDRWIATGLAGYAETRDRVDLENGTSRLSADLHLGLLSPTEVVERVVAEADGPGSHAYRNELVWREFYAHVLAHWPTVRHAAFRSAFDAVAWSGDKDALEAWRAGRTGYPVVDAAMRQLLATGWMPNRARMIVASFLTKDLLIDWRAGEAHFMRHLIDGDVASNNGGWQWSASVGTDPQPYFRIFNPVSQGRRFDPDGDYVRRWVPELAGEDAAWIHEPGERPAADYPPPIVDHAEARRRALAAYDEARRTS